MSTPDTLTTGQCAARLGVSADFIRNEIRDGRLPATRLERPGKRAVLRISRTDFDRYIYKHCGRADQVVR